MLLYRHNSRCYTVLTVITMADGFQLLHAVYAVEAFLETLVRRLCNFHIIFFSGLSQCYPLPMFMDYTYHIL